MEDSFEQKISDVLNNPELMKQIMSMANSLGKNEDEPNTGFNMRTDDSSIRMLQKLTGFANQSGIDSQQLALLSALKPYLTSDRIKKLENAMRAAKMSKLAASFINSGGLSSISGR